MATPFITIDTSKKFCLNSLTFFQNPIAYASKYMLLYRCAKERDPKGLQVNILKNPIIVNGYCTNVVEQEGNHFLIVNLDNPSNPSDENMISVPIQKEVCEQVIKALDDCFVVIVTLTGHISAHNYVPSLQFENITLDYLRGEGKVEKTEAAA